MCGFVGWIGSQGQARRMAERAAQLLRHRGPDDEGSEEGAGWALAFRRLSILDTSALGHQPMVSRDRRFVLVFNGEIYNYLELRRELEQQGERFRGGSDTAVLLALLARRGVEGLSALNGMFALCLIDTQARTFLLARDRLGVKPLYYSQHGQQIRFASELKALLAWPDASRAIEPGAIRDYLALGYLPGTRCVFTGYAKLAPGHAMLGSLDDPGSARTVRYWQLNINDDPASRSLTPGECCELQDLLTDAVRLRLRSDVPVGIFLSGGIDSGLIAAAAAKLDTGSLLALTVGFDDAAADETALANETARHTGLRHRVVVQHAGHLTDVDRLAWTYDEPMGDPAALPLFALCRTAAEHATVFLSGDGGDEAFGGYRRYVETLRWRGVLAAASRVSGCLQGVARAVPPLSRTRYRLEKLALPGEGCAAYFESLPSDPAVLRLLPGELRCHAAGTDGMLWRHWTESAGAKSVTARQQRLDYATYLPDDILTKVDRASMAHSIEVRSPLLDVRLVEWTARLPRGALLRSEQGKLPLRWLAARTLPPAVAAGPKHGFSVPLDRWFRTPGGIGLIRDRLLSATARQLGLWDAAGVETILAAHTSGRGRSFGTLLWRLLMLQAWAEHYYTGASRTASAVPGDGHGGTPAARPAGRDDTAQWLPVVGCA